LYSIKTDFTTPQEKMMKKTQLLFSCLLICNCLTSIKAETLLGLYAGYHYWQHDLSDEIDVDLDNINKSEKGNVFYVALEHPVPFLPNVKLKQNEIKGQLTGTFTLMGIDGVIRNIISTSRNDLSHTDVTLYYEVWDNWLNLDVGLNVKHFDVNAIFYEQGNRRGPMEFDDWVPLLYAKGQVDLPLTGFSAYGSIQALSLDNTEVTDAEVGVNYESSSGLGAVLGYRSLDVDFVNNNNLTSQAKTDGFFVGVNFHF